MKVTLAGPDDLGRWVLHSPTGLAYPLVQRHEDPHRCRQAVRLVATQRRQRSRTTHPRAPQMVEWPYRNRNQSTPKSSSSSESGR